MKLTVILSPNTKTGTSTVGNYLATSLAKKTNGLTLYIEFSKVTGRSLFFHGKVSETRRTISEVIYDPKTLQKQIIKSKYTEFLHFLCMNVYEDFLHMTTYVPSVMASIITEASRFYEHIIIDLPANFEEPMLGTVLSRNFEHRIDNFICVLDEDVLTAKLLYDLEALLKMGKESKPKELTYVVNKVSEHYIDYLESSLNIGLIVPVNLVKLPFIMDIKDATNRADAYRLGSSVPVKKFYAGIDMLRDIVISNKRGIGLEKSVLNETDRSMNTDINEKKSKGKKEKSAGFFKGKKSKKQEIVAPEKFESETMLEEETFDSFEENELGNCLYAEDNTGCFQEEEFDESECPPPISYTPPPIPDTQIENSDGFEEEEIEDEAEDPFSDEALGVKKDGDM